MGEKVADALRAVAGRMQKWKQEMGELEERLRRALRELEVCRREDVSERKAREETRLRLLGSMVGCFNCKLKFPTRGTTKNMLREMDHSSLPLDAQCRAAEEELGHLVFVDRLLLVRSPSNSRSSDPTYKFAGAVQVHCL